MDQDSREQYQHFLLHSNVATDLVEFREGRVLRMVSLVDRLADGLSSVYAFFDPVVRRASFGTYNILWQIERCRALGLPSVPGVLDRGKPKDGVQSDVSTRGGADRRLLGATVTNFNDKGMPSIYCCGRQELLWSYRGAVRTSKSMSQTRY